jgi:S-formylglutathione hydrolase FrmB
MALREFHGAPGAPWHRELEGRFDEWVVESEVLKDNPLGDPPQRPLYVYSAPGAGDGSPVPAVYVIQGYSGQVDNWLARTSFEPTFIERLDAMFGAGDCPPAVVVLVDAWTAVGGSQFLNSIGTGRYMDYLCDEVPAFVDERHPTIPDRDHRALAGKSSGGYGAMVVPMLRPDVFGALASHAGDALFENCYARDFGGVVRVLRDHFDGSLDKLLDAVRTADHFDWDRFGAAFSLYAYALAYTPDPEEPTRPLLPFDLHTGRLIDDVWQRWLELDPVRMASHHADALRSMRRIYLDAGKSDEFFLDLGAQAFAAELDAIGARYTLELFDGTHGGISYRYPGAVRELVVALSD